MSFASTGGAVWAPGGEREREWALRRLEGPCGPRVWGVSGGLAVRTAAARAVYNADRGGRRGEAGATQGLYSRPLATVRDRARLHLAGERRAGWTSTGYGPRPPIRAGHCCIGAYGPTGATRAAGFGGARDHERDRGDPPGRGVWRGEVHRQRLGSPPHQHHATTGGAFLHGHHLLGRQRTRSNELTGKVARGGAHATRDRRGRTWDGWRDAPRQAARTQTPSTRGHERNPANRQRG